MTRVRFHFRKGKPVQGHSRATRRSRTSAGSISEDQRNAAQSAAAAAVEDSDKPYRGSGGAGRRYLEGDSPSELTIQSGEDGKGGISKVVRDTVTSQMDVTRQGNAVAAQESPHEMS